MKIEVLVLILGTPVMLEAQETINAPGGYSGAEVGEVIEWLVENMEEEANLETVADQLAELHENPLNLNEARQEDLKKLMFLNDQQIYNLLAYRINHRQLFSIYELQAVSGFDPVTIRHLLPFIRVGSLEKEDEIEPARVIQFGRHKVLFRIGRILEPREGYSSGGDSSGSSIPSGRYVGSPERVLIRYRFQYRKRVYGGFSAEKDPGEMFFGPRKNAGIENYMGKTGAHGFDAYSFFAVYKTPGFLRAFHAGDYQVYAGQGLTLGGGGAFGRPLDYGGLKPSLSGIRPHSGSDENRYFRGVAAELQSGNLRLLLFYSYNKMDARVPDTLQEGLDPEPVVPDYSGYHRTLTELSKKNTLSVSAAGVHLCYEKQSLRLGLSAVRTRFGIPVSGGSGIRLQVRPSFSGQEQLGLDYRIIAGRFHFFGEWSMTGNRILAMVHGVTALVHSKVHLTILYRNYPAAYQNIYSSGYARRDPFNEKGISMRFVVLPVRKLTFQGMFDYSVYPWLRFRVDRPSEGRDATLLMEYQPDRTILVSGRIRHSRFQQNVGAGHWIEEIGDFQKTSYRLQVSSDLFPSVQIKNRIEWVSSKQSSTRPASGFLALTGIRWQTPTDRLVLYMNYAFFDTWSYAERIYAYEPEVLYAYASTAYYDCGMKWSGLIRWKFADVLTAWLKLSRMWFRDLPKLGSGPETISGNKKTEVKLQLMLTI